MIRQSPGTDLLGREVSDEVISTRVVPDFASANKPVVKGTNGPIPEDIVPAGKILLHRNRHEIRPRRVLDPVAQMQSPLECLLASSDVWVAVVPSQLLDLGDIS